MSDLVKIHSKLKYSEFPTVPVASISFLTASVLNKTRYEFLDGFFVERQSKCNGYKLWLKLQDKSVNKYTFIENTKRLLSFTLIISHSWIRNSSVNMFNSSTTILWTVFMRNCGMLVFSHAMQIQFIE